MDCRSVQRLVKLEGGGLQEARPGRMSFAQLGTSQQKCVHMRGVLEGEVDPVPLLKLLRPRCVWSPRVH